MDSYFGEYITKEYGLLKQILSYLKPCDLHSARLVCREWQKAVDNLVDKDPFIITCKHGQKDPMPRPTKPILPNLIIYQNVVSKQFGKQEKCEVCKTRFLVCYCEVTGPETAVLVLNNPAVTTEYNMELYSFWQIPSAIALSSPKNILLSSLQCDNHKKSITKRSIHDSLTDVNEPIKGIFVVAKNHCRKVTEKILNEVVERQGPTFAVGGGITNNFLYKGPNKERKGGFYIVFTGNNVSAHSELVAGGDAVCIEKSMSDLKERAGEVPEGGTQIAFIAQCVDRKGVLLEKMEACFFRKYFPNVPQCGFRAWGEFGIKSGSSDDMGPRNNSKRKKLTFFRSYTTSILILTMRKS